MGSSNVAFHVPPDARPDHLFPFLKALKQRGGFITSKQVPVLFESLGFKYRSEVIQWGEFLGFVERTRRSKGAIVLTSLGEDFLCLRPVMQGEVAHFLSYTRWSNRNPAENTRFWSYRQITDWLWEHSPLHISPRVRTILVEEIIALSTAVFKGVAGYRPDKVSFSKKSLNGVFKWLAILFPPVLQDEHFTRRTYCPPETFLLALGWVVEETGASIGEEFLFNDERQEMIARLCLLEPRSVNRVLEDTLHRFPSILKPGTKAGFYGRFLLLKEKPSLHHLLPKEAP